MRNHFLSFCRGSILAFFAFSFFNLNAQVFNYTKTIGVNTLDITITASNPCDDPSVNVGSISFTVNAASGGSATLLVLDGPGGTVLGQPIGLGPGNTFVFTPTNPSAGVYNYIIRNINNTVTINSFVEPASYPPITLANFAVIALTDEGSNSNSSCLIPDGVIQSTVTGGSGNFTYVLDLGGTPVSSGTPTAGVITVGGLVGGNYTLTVNDDFSNCFGTRNFTVTNATPVVSTPFAALCINGTMTASPATGGTWVSNSPSVASITPSGGLITGLAAGSVTFTFTETATGCSATTAAVTINALPVVSTPSSSLCVGATMTASPSTGGSWVSNATGVASITTGGLITGIAPGPVTFTFTESLTGCSNTTSVVTVNANVVPSVSISAAPGNVICASTSVTFTAVPTNGGTTPAYQWKKNGSNVGTNSTTYTDAALANGDQITVVMTTNAICPTTPTATSNQITMTVTPTVVPSVSISAAPGNVICASTSVTFTAVPTNGGTTPAYQWKKNGGNVGTNSTTYTDAALANGDQITVVMTTNAVCPTTPTATSNQINMTVNANVVPSVSISAAPGNVICASTSVTFTAVPTNGGTTPAYQWKKNGSNVGTNSTTYTDAALANGDQITVVMTTNAICPTTPTATSNQITMTVTPTVVPSVSIGAAPGSTICAGTSVTFTATPTNGGTTPAYQWKKNGGNVGTNSDTYTDAALANGDQITVVMTTNAVCPTTPTATSNQITMTVNANVVPSVSISAAPGNVICASTSVTFTAVPTNGGTTPAYQWKKNGGNVGTNSTTYTDAALANGDQITVVMTTNAICPTTPTATSNQITMTVTPTVVPSVSIGAAPGSTICAGTSVTFTATPTNGGTTPAYQWKKNGGNVGTNSDTYTDAALANGDQITVVMTTNAVCPTTPTATSNQINMTVNPNLVPSVSIGAAPGSTICAGTSVTFTATPTNGGTTPIYQWKKNGSNVGTNSTTFVDATLVTGDQITVDMTSNATCLTTASATSNQITMTVNANVVPQVVITANPGSTICASTSVTFTATPVNGGASPTFQWKKNGGNVGTNSATYTDATLANGDVIEVSMTSNATCPVPATVASNQITMTVSASLLPQVVITPNPGSTICAGTNVTFTAVPVNGGASPAFQWKKNGANVGTNSVTYVDATLANGDAITVVMTSNATCVSTPTATSNIITMTVNPTVTPSVIIAAAPNGTICEGTSVTFTATPTNGGTTPTYQWKKNGANVGTNSTTYVDAGLLDNDVIEVDMTSNATCPLPVTVTSNQITMDVTTNVTPSVVISSNAGSTICVGDNVTFTAVPTNGGTTPIYQWKKNGSNVGTNSTTYADAGLNDTDVIVVDLTSNEVCVTTTAATSNQITMTVVSNLTPTVTIAANPGTTICPGTSVTFTANPVGGGTTPAFQWKKNGGNVGTNSNTYVDASLSTGDVIEVTLTSSASCATTPTATSNQLTMTINPTVAPSVSIVASPVGTICAGTSVTFTASPTNGGASPIYQWKKNGVAVGTNSDTYVDASLNNSDVIEVDMTSNATCPVPATVTSNQITMVVTPSVTPSVVITSNVGSTICTGDNVTFTAAPTNGGATPTYQWKKNGVNVGTNSVTYADAGLVDTDVIEVDMTSNATCASPAVATSNTITMTVVTSLLPTVSISANPGTTVCPGINVTFTATITGGGTSPSYQWKKNGVNVGTNSATYSDATLINGNTITVELTSSASCASTPTVISNPIAMTILPPGDPSCGGGGGTNCFAFVITVDLTLSHRPSCSNQNDGVIALNISGSVPGNYLMAILSGGVPVQPPQSGPSGLYVFSGLSPGNYQYSILDQAGNLCVQDFALLVQTTVDADATGFVNASCFGEATGQATITVNSGGASPYFYSLDNGGSWLSFTSPHTITDLPPNGTYSILVADDPSDQCPDEVSVTIGNSNPRIKGTFAVTNASCNVSDGAIDVTSTTGGAGGPYSFRIDGVSATEPFANLSGGSHIISMIDKTGCARDTAITVTFPGFVTYSAPATTIDATCTTKGVIGIFIPNPPGSYEIGFTTDPVNQPTNYNSGYYNPATGLVIINKLEAGTYYVWIRTSSTSCPTRFENSPGIYEVVIGGPQPVSFEVGCRDRDGVLSLNNISASSSDPIFYEIFGNGFQKSGQITPNAIASDTIHGFTTGDYVVWLRQDQATFGCTVYSDTLSAPAGALDTLSVTKNVSFPDQPTGSIKIKLKGSGAEPYEAWLVETAFNSDTLTAVRNPVIFEVNFSSLAAATYSLYIEDAAGCRKEYVIIIPSDDSIFIPNIFTPNNDGINEEFYVRNLPSSGSKLSITNRWGKEVFSSGNYNPGNLWNGGGSPDGVYYYRLQIEGGKTYTGWVEIVRGVKP